jgi:integrase
MSIRQTGKSGIWEVRFTLPGGRRIEQSTGTADKKAAQQLHDKWKHEAWQQARLGKKPDRLWEELAKVWLDDAEANGKASLRDDVAKVRWFTQHLGGKRLSEINEDVIRDLVRLKRVQKNRYGKAVTNSTINRYLALLRAMLRKAWLELKWVEQSPPVIKLFKEPEGIVRWIEPQQAVLLLQELPLHQRRMVIFALAVGLRQSNVKRLTWAQINMQTRTMRVDAGSTKGNDHIGIPLNSMAMDVLHQCVGQHAEYVFTFNGNPVTQVNTRAWRNALKRAGIENFRWHDLRHTWASWLRQQGVPTSDIKEMGKWKSDKMVDRYAHLNVEHLRPHSDALGNMLGGVTSLIRPQKAPSVGAILGEAR